jgi:dihydroorotate dehydrogenase
MSTLAATVDGLKFNNPFVIGSGPPGTNVKVIKRAFKAGWGGVIAKTVSLDCSKVVNVGPRYAKLIPELPRLVHLFLQHQSQHVPNPQTQALLVEQRRTNQLLSRLFWTGLGFVAGLLLMQLFFKTH